MEINIWDCRKDEEYHLEDFISKKQFSNLDNNFVVVEVIGTEWNRNSERLVLSEILREIPAKFISTVFYPWRGQYKINEELSKYCPMLEIDSVYFFDITGALEQFCELLTSSMVIGESGTGEWIVLFSMNPIVFDKDIATNGFSSFLDNPAKYSAMIYFAEMLQSYLFFKPFNGLDVLLGSLKKLVKDDS